ncbi:hypothetical protein [Sphingomonas bacterium]|uniref:hypothetical protein n=1 Tax=Sphingomonas bacterium TaxID=1895847 RepID=UPI0015752B32|nr:hypothetical protein [Sphingomonas bacterium]
MIVIQQADAPSSPSPTSHVQTADPFTVPLEALASPRRDCGAKPDGEIVVCGRQDSEGFRLRPLPPLPPSNGLLSRPLRVQIAPGISVGFQQGGGFGVKAEFGPGTKTREK